MVDPVNSGRSISTEKIEIQFVADVKMHLNIKGFIFYVLTFVHQCMNFNALDNKIKHYVSANK